MTKKWRKIWIRFETYIVDDICIANVICNLFFCYKYLSIILDSEEWELRIHSTEIGPLIGAEFSLFVKCFGANTIFEWFDLKFSHARAMSNFFGFWLVRGRGEIVLRKRALDSTFCPFVFFSIIFLFFICFEKKILISYFSFRYCRISIVYWMVQKWNEPSWNRQIRYL